MLRINLFSHDKHRKHEKNPVFQGGLEVVVPTFRENCVTVLYLCLVAIPGTSPTILKAL